MPKTLSIEMLKAKIQRQEELIARREISDNFYFTGRRGDDLEHLLALQKQLRELQEPKDGH